MEYKRTPEQENLLILSKAINMFLEYVGRIARTPYSQYIYAVEKASGTDIEKEVMEKLDMYTRQERKTLHTLMTNSYSQLGILIERVEDFIEYDKSRANDEEE